MKKTTIRQRAEEILRVTNEEFQQPPGCQPSGGMKQKTGFNLCPDNQTGNPDPDEPTYGVDPESRKEFWKILYRLNKEGVTLMVSTPYMDEAELCHRVAIISQGRVVAVGTPCSLNGAYPTACWK